MVSRISTTCSFSFRPRESLARKNRIVDHRDSEKRWTRGHWHRISFVIWAMLTGYRGAFLFGLFALSFVPSLRATSFPTSGPTVPGPVAFLRRGVAYAPANAPLAVKRAIWAANQLRSKPYRWGGGHASFSMPVMIVREPFPTALAGAGLIRIPMSLD